MIPATLRIVLSVAVICYFIIILYYLKKRMLELRYTLIWLAAGLCMGIMVFFPGLLIDFVYPMLCFYYCYFNDVNSNCVQICNEG